MNNILAIVVTYNRKNLLLENIKALKQQSFNKFDILIIDNNSTDNTYDFIKNEIGENIKYYNTTKNIGGAGGFNIGIKKAIQSGYDYVWIMDDDTIPEENSLKKIYNAKELLNDNFSFLCSLVKWTDGDFCNMNKPKVSNNILENFFVVNNGLIKVESCSFVSCFINAKYIKRVGLPIKEFFIYGDDAEYTYRLSRKEKAFLVTDSVVLHKMNSNYTTDIVDIEKNKIDRMFYNYRNLLYINRKKGIKYTTRYLLAFNYKVVKVILCSKDSKLRRIGVMIKGFCKGLFFFPKIEKIDKN